MTLPDASLPVVDPPPTSMQLVATSQIGVLGLSLELRVVLP